MIASSAATRITDAIVTAAITPLVIPSLGLCGCGEFDVFEGVDNAL